VEELKEGGMRDLDLAAKLSLLNMLAKISLAVTEFVPPDFGHSA
jgi:hypothetical protein